MLREYTSSCLAHVVNLAISDFMSTVMKTSIIETCNVIWDYNPEDPSASISMGSRDLIAMIRTLAIKIQASGQRIQRFHRLQLDCGIAPPLNIPLHNNTRWGSALGMCQRAYKLRKVSLDH